MFSANDKISIRQLQALLILDLFGIGVITLPGRAAALAGQNGWILILAAAGLVACYSLVLTLLYKRYPEDSFVEYSQKIVTKPVGVLLSVGLAVKILLSAGLTLRIFCEILRQTMLFRTPMAVNCAAMLLLSAFTAAKGYECRGRVAEILVLFLAIPLIFIFAVAAVNSDFSNLLPVFALSGKQLVSGTIWIALSFQGLEFLLLAGPYVRRPEKAGRAVFFVLIFIGILMTLLAVITLARFGPADIQRKLWPVLQMMDTIEMPGSFMERQDAIVMKFFIISTFAGTAAGLFLASLCAKRLVPKKSRQKYWIYGGAAALFLIAVLPPDLAETYRLAELVNVYLGGFYFFLAPLALLAVDYIRRRGVKANG